MGKIFQKLVEYIEAEDIKGIIRYCLILLPFVAAAIFAVAFIVNYVTAHKEALIVIGVAACMIIPPLLGKKSEKPAEKSIATNSRVAYFDKLLTKAVFRIFTDYAKQFQTIPPKGYQSIKDDIPSGLDVGRKITVYRFKIAADGDPISKPDFCELLTSHLQDLLVSGELPLGKATAEFAGKLYPKVSVDQSVYAGGAWHIELLVCDDENVARYIDGKNYAIVMRNAGQEQYFDDDF